LEIEAASEENENTPKIGGELMKNGSGFGVECRKRLGQLSRVSLAL